MCIRDSVSRARVSVRRIALPLPRVRLALPSVRLALPRPSLPTSLRFPRTRTVSLIAVGLAVLVFCAIALARLGATPARSPQAVAGRAQHAIAAASPTALVTDPAIWARAVHRAAGARRGVPVVHQRPRSAKPRVRSRVGSETPAPASTPSSPPATGFMTPVSTSSASSAGSSAGGGGSAAAGPQGAGAPFGPGHLG